MDVHFNLVFTATIPVEKNFFEDKTGSKVKISKNINKYKLFLTFDSKENLDDFITKLN